MTAQPRVSIVLPTRNGMATLPQVVEALARQKASYAHELVAIDSSSSDGTAEFMRARADRFIEIPAAAFNHGLSRNAAIEQSRGELVVLLVQDAIPASDVWLETLTAPLVHDATIAGTFARQLPHKDASPITRHYLSRWAAAGEASRAIRLDGRAEFERLNPLARVERCTFDNVCSCIRRSVWQAHPFRRTAFGEDLEWAKEVLLAGGTLVYVPDAVVYHSHDRSARYEFLRTYTLHRRLYELFQLRTIPSVPALARAIGSTLRLHAQLQWNMRAAALAVAWPLGQYLGALSAIKGWKPLRTSGI